MPALHHIPAPDFDQDRRVASWQVSMDVEVLVGLVHGDGLSGQIGLARTMPLSADAGNKR